MRAIGSIGTVITVGPAGSVPSRVWFVDSANGSDDNDGESEDQAFQTLARLDLSVGQTVMLRRGSRFREEIIGWPAVRLRAYGDGDRPIIDAREVATEWEEYDTDVWRTAWEHGFGPDGGKSKHRVWRDGVMMARAGSLAACLATPDTFWADTPTTGGPDWVYIHSDPEAFEYKLSKRRYCVQLYDSYNQADVEGVEAIGNSYADGAFLIDGRVMDCIARDGRIHNFFILGLAEDCQALGTETTESYGMYVTYYAAGFGGGPSVRDVIYRRCVADALQTNTLGVGFEAHTDGVRFFGTIQYEDCESIGNNGGYSGVQAETFVYYRCNFTNPLLAYLAAGTSRAVILGGQGTIKNAANGRLFQYTSGAFELIVHGVRVYKLGNGFGPCHIGGANITATIERCTLVGAGSASQQFSAGNITYRRNVSVAPNMTSVLLANASAQVVGFDADNNCHWSAGINSPLLTKLFGGAQDFTTLANWRTYLNGVALGTGREASSVAMDPQIADPVNGDFTIGNPAVLALGAGAEPDEEDDPELQALWALYRITP